MPDSASSSEESSDDDFDEVSANARRGSSLLVPLAPSPPPPSAQRAASPNKSFKKRTTVMLQQTEVDDEDFEKNQKKASAASKAAPAEKPQRRSSIYRDDGKADLRAVVRLIKACNLFSKGFGATPRRRSPARSTMRQTQRALTGRRPSRLLPPPTEDFAEWFLRSQHPTTSARLRKEMASTLGPVAICDRLDIDVLLRVAVRQLRFVAGAGVVTIHTMNRRTGRLRPRFSTDMARWKRCHPSRPEDPTVHGLGDGGDAKRCLGVLQLTNRLNRRAWLGPGPETRGGVTTELALAQRTRAFSHRDECAAYVLAAAVSFLLYYEREVRAMRSAQLAATWGGSTFGGGRGALVARHGGALGAGGGAAHGADATRDLAVSRFRYAQCACSVLQGTWIPKDVLDMNLGRDGERRDSLSSVHGGADDEPRILSDEQRLATPRMAMAEAVVAATLVASRRLECAHLSCYRLEALEMHLNAFVGATKAFSAFRRCFKRRRRETWWMSPVQGKFKKFNLVGLSRHVKNARRMQHAFWHLDDDIRARIRRRKVKDDIRSHAKRAGARKRPWFDGFPMVALDDDAAPRPSPVRKPPARVPAAATPRPRSPSRPRRPTRTSTGPWSARAGPSTASRPCRPSTRTACRARRARDDVSCVTFNTRPTFDAGYLEDDLTFDADASYAKSSVFGEHFGESSNDAAPARCRASRAADPLGSWRSLALF
ncbi:hypothetical protein JL720_15661 [Aureococcus anophagefferens]|nr:hypothetical protein JL720_15661 [Aureococcus anophagefferens]